MLTRPGLSVIVSAIIGARKIFQRMTTYSKYTVAMTFRICFTFGLLTVIYNWCASPCSLLRSSCFMLAGQLAFFLTLALRFLSFFAGILGRPRRYALPWIDKLLYCHCGHG